MTAAAQFVHEELTQSHGTTIQARRHDLTAIEAMASRLAVPPALATQVLGHALGSRGVSLSPGEIEDLFNLVLAADWYARTRVG